MAKPRPSHSANGYWDSLSDHKLIEANLTIDDPNSLPQLVRELPPDHHEAHIEYAYDQRNSGRAEEDYFTCVHQHHRHLYGAVMRVRDVRFLVGWQCAAEIYGENLEHIRADFDGAIARQGLLIRIRDLREALVNMAAWASDVANSSAIDDFQKVRDSLKAYMPFVFQTLRENRGRKIDDTPMPGQLCADEVSAEGQFVDMTNIITETLTALSGDTKNVAQRMGPIRERIDTLVLRADLFCRRMSDIELFFQPATLSVLCEVAQRSRQRPKKLTAQLLTLRTREYILKMPEGFRVPSRAPVDALRRVLAS